MNLLIFFLLGSLFAAALGICGYCSHLVDKNDTPANRARIFTAVGFAIVTAMMAIGFVLSLAPSR